MQQPPVLSFLGLLPDISQVSKEHGIIRFAPPALLHIPPGTILKTNVERSAFGSAILQTPHGPLGLESKYPIPKGAQVEAKIIATNDQLQIKLVTVNGKPAAEALPITRQDIANHTQTAAKDPLIFQAPSQDISGKSPTPGTTQAPGNNQLSTTPAPVTSQTGTTQETVSVKTGIPNLQGQSIQTVLLQTKPQELAQIIQTFHQESGGKSNQNPLLPQLNTTTNASSPITAEQIQRGTTLVFKIVDVQLPTNTQTAGPSPATTQGPLNNPQTNPLTQTSITPSTPEAKITAPTEQPVAKPASPLQLQAKVIGHEKTGEPILKLPFGIVKGPVEHQLPKESTVTVQLTTVLPQPSVNTTSPVFPKLDPVAQLLRYWSAAQSTFDTLNQSSTPESKHILKSLFPNQENHSALKLMQTMQAFQGGNPSSWITQKIMQFFISQGKEHMISQLRNNIGPMHSTFVESPPSGWQAFFLPFYDGNELQQVQFYIRDDAGKQEDEENGSGTRFVIEIKPESQSPIQLDGYVKKHHQRKQFDLVVRTERPLVAEVQETIREIFISANEITGMKGHIAFKVERELSVKPFEEVVTSHSKSVLA